MSSILEAPNRRCGAHPAKVREIGCASGLWMSAVRFVKSGAGVREIGCVSGIAKSVAYRVMHVKSGAPYIDTGITGISFR